MEKKKDQPDLFEGKKEYLKTTLNTYTRPTESQISSEIDSLLSADEKGICKEIAINKGQSLGPSMQSMSLPDKNPFDKTIRISQSLMKAVRSYLEGGDCGIVIREKYIKGRVFDGESSKAMRLGIYFEYILTGALPKSGVEPKPEYMTTAIKAQAKVITDNKKIADANVTLAKIAKGLDIHISDLLKPGGKPKVIKEFLQEKVLGVADMYEGYREAHANAYRLLKTWDEMGLEIATDKNGKKLAGWRIMKGRYEGTIDVVLRAKRDISFLNMSIDGLIIEDKGFSMKEGDMIAGDIKLSGLKDDKWSVHGWQWTPIQKRYHGTQAKHYYFLSTLPQTFWVVDPKGNYILFFRCVIDQAAVDAHIEEGNTLHKRLMELEHLGALEARPEVNKCNDCVLFAECNYKHTFPHPVVVDLTDNGH